jgi:hypothetical protein
VPGQAVARELVEERGEIGAADPGDVDAGILQGAQDCAPCSGSDFTHKRKPAKRPDFQFRFGDQAAGAAKKRLGEGGFRGQRRAECSVA